MSNSDDGRPSDFEPVADIEEILLSIREMMRSPDTGYPWFADDYEDDDDLPLMFRRTQEQQAQLPSPPPPAPPYVLPEAAPADPPSISAFAAAAAAVAALAELPDQPAPPPIEAIIAFETEQLPAIAEPPRVMVDCRSTLAMRMGEFALKAAAEDRVIALGYGPLLPVRSAAPECVFALDLADADGNAVAFLADADPEYDGMAELMRPLLRQWVDENMSCIVQKAVCGEAAVN